MKKISKLFDNRIFKLVTGIIRFFVIVVLVCYIGFILVQRLTGNKSIGGYRVFTVVTASMKGVYNVNDVIIVKDCDTNKLKVGDDVAYLGNRAGLENKIITHRIIKIEDSSDGRRIFTTQGVASEYEDPSITSDQVLGQVVGVLPFITQINHLIHHNVGFFTLIFIPLVLVIVLEILQTITEYQLEKNEIQEINKDE